LPKFVVQIRKAKKFFYKSQLIWPTKLNKGGIKMKRKIVNFMTSFIMLSLLVSVLVIADFSLPLLNSCGKSTAYAMGRRPRRRHHPPISGNPAPIPEPSTLFLLGSGLAVGGGIYAFIRYRKRNKK